MSNNEFKPTYKRFKNGSTIKHRPNGRITIWEQDESVIIELRNGSLSKEDLKETACITEILKGKVMQTGIKISFEAAAAMHEQLGDLLGRVLNERSA